MVRELVDSVGHCQCSWTGICGMDVNLGPSAQQGGELKT